MMQNSAAKKESEIADLKRIKLERLAKKTAEIELKAQKRAKLIRLKNRPKDKAKRVKLTQCFLCGAMVELLREHKHKIHGESLTLPSQISKHSNTLWVPIYQGGAPGLGKKSS